MDGCGLNESAPQVDSSNDVVPIAFP
jgi:hypothetical protein